MKRNQQLLVVPEREWMFEQKQWWEIERQSNLITNNLMRKTSFGRNSKTISKIK
jgi:hypothetical protein